MFDEKKIDESKGRLFVLGETGWVYRLEGGKCAGIDASAEMAFYSPGAGRYTPPQRRHELPIEVLAIFDSLKIPTTRNTYYG